MVVRSSRRRGFTLLEVILALFIGTMLLAGLYAALSLQLEHARTARDVLNEAAVVRELMARITNDVSPIQGPISPFLNASGAYTNSSTGSSTIGPQQSSSSSSSQSSGTSGGGNSSGNSSNSSQTNTNVINVAITNMGVKGEGDWVVFTVSRTPREVLSGTESGQQPVCDLRRISYAVVPGVGLVRKEDTNILEPNNIGPVGGPDLSEPYEVVAPEVTQMKIEYFGDSGGWQESWDGSTASLIPSASGSTNSPGGTQKGPPGLLRFTFTLSLPPPAGREKGRTTVVSHTVAIPAANRWVSSTIAPEAASPNE